VRPHDIIKKLCLRCAPPKFLSELRHCPPGLVISTDAGKGIDIAVTKIFTNGVEHRECMRHLYKNFKKKYRVKVFEKNLWPATRAYRKDIFDNHYNIMKASSAKEMKWIELSTETHRRATTGNTKSREVARALEALLPRRRPTISVTRPEDV